MRMIYVTVKMTLTKVGHRIANNVPWLKPSVGRSLMELTLVDSSR